jgi:hypothetical protein
MFAEVFVALFAAHQVADHWVQTQKQADTKALPGWPGRRACAAHVATHTLTTVVALAAVAARTGMHLHPAALAAGLAINVVTHYIADRRTPLKRIAERIGSGPFYRLAGHGMNGAYLLDQSWHVGWLFIAALVIA